MKRLVRLASLAAVVAAVVATVRALRRPNDPLPSPADTASAPWPPLRPEDATTVAPVTPDPVPTPDAAPAPNPPDGEVDADVVRVPEPDGVPVADASTVEEGADPVAGAPWVEPTAEGECPDGYPIKAKMSSKIFHSPGQLNYDRTTPDRCYVDTDAAEADGLRAAKR